MNLLPHDPTEVATALTLFRRLFVALSGVVIAVIAATVLAGYLFEITNLTHWRGPVGMALPTAFCFLLTGASFVALATDFEPWTRRS